MKKKNQPQKKPKFESVTPKVSKDTLVLDTMLRGAGNNLFISMSLTVKGGHLADGVYIISLDVHMDDGVVKFGVKIIPDEPNPETGEEIDSVHIRFEYASDPENYNADKEALYANLLSDDKDVIALWLRTLSYANFIVGK